MKHIIKLLSGLFFFALFAIANSSHSAGIEYYGFFASSWQTVNILVPGSQTQTVANFTNTSWIVDSSNGDITNDIGIAIQNGQKSIVDLSFIFYPSQSSGGVKYNPNFQANWNSFVAALNAKGPAYVNNIVAFYPIDEPNGNGIALASIKAVNAAIHASFPQIPNAVIYSNGVDTTSMPYYDWIGFDCYSNGNFMCGTTNYTSAYAKMKAAIKSTQQIILIPQVGLPSGNLGCCVSALTLENSRYYDLAYGDPQVIGIFGFRWQNLGGWVGLNGISQLQSAVMGIGQAVKSNWTYPAGIVPVYRFTSEYSNTDHFFTLSEQEGISAAIAGEYVFEGFGFNLYTSQIAGSHPMYRCRTTGGRHFVSTLASCEGQNPEGLLGYASNAQTSTTVPLYRFNNPSNGSHLETVSYSEGTAAGLTYEGIQGYSPSVSY